MITDHFSFDSIQKSLGDIFIEDVYEFTFSDVWISIGAPIGLAVSTKNLHDRTQEFVKKNEVKRRFALV